MFYLKDFEQHSEYEAYMSSGEAILPNVSICDDEPTHVHYNAAQVGPTYEAVDLGLPSGTLWANMNVGAETETDYGDYFMWGSTTPDTNNTCDWAHAPFNGGASSFDSTYFNAHKSEWLTEEGNLKPEYDAAHVIMGGDWRMPTKADCNELLSGTTNEWVTNYQGSGVNGRLFTSKANGNTMFIPAEGGRNGSSFLYQGVYGNVWSSLLYTDVPAATWVLYFGSTGHGMASGDRYCGYSVRGVIKR